MTKGKSHYGSGGGYNHFAGRFVFLLSIYVDWRDALICFLVYSFQCFSLMGIFFHVILVLRDASRAFVSGNFTGTIFYFPAFFGVLQRF